MTDCVPTPTETADLRIRRKGLAKAKEWATLHEMENIGVNPVARDFWRQVGEEFQKRKP